MFFLAELRGPLTLAVATALLASCGSPRSSTSPGRETVIDAAIRDAGTSPRWSTDTAATWSAMLEVLPGLWKATTPEGRTITIRYHVVANGSALVETFLTASGKETLTVYHRDGRALMLTHYCAQGNQARLKATEANGDMVVFAFLDATNIAPDQDVMVKLTFSLERDTFVQESVYRTSTGQPDTTRLQFVRAMPPD